MSIGRIRRPDATVGRQRAEAVGCRPLMKSAARCAGLAAVTIARLSAVSTSSQLAMYAARFLTRLTGQIKVGTEERSTEFRHLFFERVALGPETCGAEVARQARFVCGPVRRLVRGWRSSCRRPGRSRRAAA